MKHCRHIVKFKDTVGSGSASNPSLDSLAYCVGFRQSLGVDMHIQLALSILEKSDHRWPVPKFAHPRMMWTCREAFAEYLRR